MARSTVRNISGQAVTLPYPYRGIVRAGAAAVVDGTPDEVIENLGGPTSIVGLLSIEPAADLAFIAPQGVARRIALTTTLYVDPVSGDDSAAGFFGSPIKTLLELSKRIPSFGPLNVELLAGNHLLPDFQTPSAPIPTLRPIFLLGSFSRVRLHGQSALVQNVTVTGVVANVISVAETLVAGALVGEFIEFGVTPTQRWIIANDTSSITVAASVASFGGTVVLPTSGTLMVRTLTSKVVGPVLNGPFGSMFLWGSVELNSLLFDANINGATAAAPVRTGLAGCEARLTMCKFLGPFGTAVGFNGVGVLTTCYFDRQWVSGGLSGTVAGVGLNVSAASDCVFKDYATGFNLGGSSSQLSLLGGSVIWINRCTNFVNGRGILNDFSTFLWIDNGLTNYVFMGTGFIMFKQNNALRAVTSHATLGTAYNGSNYANGQVCVSFAASTTLNCTTGFCSGDAVVTVAQFNAGTAPATGVRRYNDTRGNHVFAP